MKSSSFLFTAIPAVLVCLALATGCSKNNSENNFPTAPLTSASPQQQSNVPLAPVEVALQTANWDNSRTVANSESVQRVSATSQAAVPLYAVTDLGTLGGNFSAALDINASGQIVGGATLADGTLHPFLYQNGNMFDLGTLGGSAGAAASINDAGEIVGQVDNAQGARRGFFYHNNMMVEIPTLGGSESRAASINAHSQIAGRARLATNNEHAFLYLNAQIFDLGTLGGSTSWANGINVSGQIVGGSYAPPDGRWHAYFLNQNTMTDLGTLGGVQSVAFGQNDAGQIVGWSNADGSAVLRATLWSNGMITDLGTVGGESIAYAINDLGQIVGHAYTSDNRQHAFLINDGPMQDLNDLIPNNSGWELSIATKMSNDGHQIVGRGIINGENHAFLLTLDLAQAIDDLIDLVQSFDLPKGIENSVLTKLNHAEDSIKAGDPSGACSQLGAFINEVQAQAGKKLTQEQADQLLAGANQIRTALGCQG